MMWGQVLDKKAAKAMDQYYSQLFGGEGPYRKAAGPYGGKLLFSVTRRVKDRFIAVTPTTVVEKDIDSNSGKLPTITIRTIDRSRVIPVLDAITNTWLQTGSILQAWIAGVEIAQGIAQDIDDGVPSLNACSRKDGESHCDSNHSCGTCGKHVSCSSMLDGIFSLRVCQLCDTKDRTQYPRGYAFTMCKFKLANTIREEHKKLGYASDHGSVVAIVRKADEELDSWFKEIEASNKYPDGYSNKERILSTEGAGTWQANDPFVLSLDAAFPYMSVPSGLRQHVKDNLVLCPLVLNLAKHTHLPAWLSMLSIHLMRQSQYHAGNLSLEE